MWLRGRRCEIVGAMDHLSVFANDYDEIPVIGEQG